MTKKVVPITLHRDTQVAKQLKKVAQAVKTGRRFTAPEILDERRALHTVLTAVYALARPTCRVHHPTLGTHYLKFLISPVPGAIVRLRDKYYPIKQLYLDETAIGIVLGKKPCRIEASAPAPGTPTSPSRKHRSESHASSAKTPSKKVTTARSGRTSAKKGRG